MPTVLQIMDFAAPYKGNFIPSIQSLGKRINQDEGRLIYLLPLSSKALDWVKELKEGGESVYFIDNSFFSKRIKYRNIKLIKEIIKKEQINIIHTHFLAYNYTLFLIKIFFTRNIYIIGHFHNTFLPPKNILYKFRILIVSSTYSLIIGVSPSVSESVIKAGIKAYKVICIPNAIDFTRLDNYKKIKLAENVNQKVLLIFGWPFQRKGVDIVLEALRQLNEENSNIILAISLAGGNEIFEKEIIKQLGNMPSWIKILKPINSVASYYNASDIFISAGREEGMNYSVMEAAYCRCSIIASEIPGNPKEIPNQYRYPVENISQLKAQISGLLKKNNTELDRMKMEQKEFVCNNYDLSIWTERVISIYKMH